VHILGGKALDFDVSGIGPCDAVVDLLVAIYEDI